MLGGVPANTVDAPYTRVCTVAKLPDFASKDSVMTPLVMDPALLGLTLLTVPCAATPGVAAVALPVKKICVAWQRQRERAVARRASVCRARLTVVKPAGGRSTSTKRLYLEAAGGGGGVGAKAA